MKNKSVPKIALIAIISYIAMIVFFQNFLLSDSFSALNFYAYDDSAFQETLWSYMQLDGKNLLSMNSYGYGWIFWFVMCILAMPARLIFDVFGIAWPLIVLPRMFALFFAVMCSVLMYKIIGKYTKNEWIKFAAVICLPMFPAGAFFAGRFSTVSVGAFFCMLSIWLVIRKDALARKDLRLALFSFAVAFGIKMSAVVAAPMLILLILNRYEWKWNLENFKIWISEALLASLAAVFFISPAILLYPFAPIQAENSIYSLKYYLNSTQTVSKIESMFELISYTNYDWISGLFCLLLIILVGIGLWGIYRKRQKDVFLKDYIAIPVGFLIGFLYLCLTIHSGITYRYMYATAISFAIPMGLITLQYIPRISAKVVKNFIIGVCIICCLSQLAYVKRGDYRTLLDYVSTIQAAKSQIATIEPIQNAISNLNLDSLVVLADYQAPYMAVNPFESENLAYRTCVWDDLHLHTDEKINVILYSKLALGSKSEEEFQNTIAAYDSTAREAAVQDHEARKMLVEKGSFNQKQWTKIYEDEFSCIFVRNDVI